jgi:hypothetical protein
VAEGTSIRICRSLVMMKKADEQSEDQDRDDRDRLL